MPRVAIVFALAPLVINACGGHEPRETGRQSAAAARVSAPQDTSFAGTMAPVQRTARPGTPPRVLRGVAATSGPGYDRVVFEFAEDSVPGYHVEYTTRSYPGPEVAATPRRTRGGVPGRSEEH